MVIFNVDIKKKFILRATNFKIKYGSELLGAVYLKCYNMNVLIICLKLGHRSNISQVNVQSF